MPGRLKQISHLLENKSSTLRSFQPRNDPGISLLQWLKAVGHTFKNFLKKLVNSDYQPVSKGGELVDTLNAILMVEHQLSLSEEDKQSDGIILKDMASEESDNLARIQPGISNNQDCTKVTNPYAFYQQPTIDVKSRESEYHTSNKPN